MSNSNSANEPSAKDTFIDKDFYTWTAMFKGLTGQLTPSEVRKYNVAHQTINSAKHQKQCEDNLDWIFSNSPIVRFLRDECGALGGHDLRKVVRCRPCVGLDGRRGGGFDPNYGIILCSNEVAGRGTKYLEDAVAHELVHAYDYLRFDMDVKNMKHQACTEIRASMLSGECRWWNEFFRRGNWGVPMTRGFQDCVKRRASASMANRRNIKDLAEGTQYVEAVWGSCFNDTRPFDEVFK